MRPQLIGKGWVGPTTCLYQFFLGPRSFMILGLGLVSPMEVGGVELGRGRTLVTFSGL